MAQAQQRYERLGHYSPEAMPEIVSGVYEDEGYMVPYMWAAILIYAFWPSMVDHLGLYRDGFLRRLPRQASMLEVACGHGVLSLMAAQERTDIRIAGHDISPPAVAVAERLLQVSGLGDRVQFKVQDAIGPDSTRDSGPFDGIVAAMLAEHLPSPTPLMQALARQIGPQGSIFMSTALESAQRDHVFEFHHESELLLLAESCGLRASHMLCGASTPRPGARFLPRAQALLLHPRQIANATKAANAADAAKAASGGSGPKAQP